MTANEAAESLGIAPRTFRSWSVPAVAKIGGVAFYDAAAILENRLEKIRQKSARADSDLDDLKREVDALETDLIRMRAKRQDLRNAELRGELVDVASITLAIGQASSACRAVLDALPGKIRRQIATLNNTDLQMIRTTIVEHENRIAAQDFQFDEDLCQRDDQPD